MSSEKIVFRRFMCVGEEASIFRSLSLFIEEHPPSQHRTLRTVRSILQYPTCDIAAPACDL